MPARQEAVHNLCTNSGDIGVPEAGLGSFPFEILTVPLTNRVCMPDEFVRFSRGLRRMHAVDKHGSDV